MRKTKKTGFTLIELLAVIVILAIIALIAVPTITNIINKANESAFKDTAYGIIQAAEYYYAASQLDLEGPMNDVKMDTTDSRLELKGDIPDGDVIITRTGDIAIAVQNGRYCATKDYSSDDVLISENVEKCTIPKRLSDIATISEKLEVDEVNACVSKGQICSVSKDNPVSFAIEVNEKDTYKFYVLKDDGNKITLIMSENLGDNVEWYVDTRINSQGPKTAVAELKLRTNEWENISEREYTYSDDGGGNRYRFFVEIMRARLITYEEATAKEIGCTTDSGSCPDWMYKNLRNTGSDTDSVGKNRNGYWLSAAYAGGLIDGHRVSCYGLVNGAYTDDIGNGLRPVIELSK